MAGVAGDGDMEVDQLAESLKNIKMPKEFTFGGHSHTPKFRPRAVKTGGKPPQAGTLATRCFVYVCDYSRANS